MSKEKSLETLLTMDGQKMVIDEKRGLWTKFQAKRVQVTDDRPHGISYSLSLHDRNNKRILGFDNAHPIEYGGKHMAAPKRQYDHYHAFDSAVPSPYQFESPEKLVTDFWIAVDEFISGTGL